MPTIAGRPSTMNSFFPVDIPQNSMVGQQRQQISERQFDKFPTPSTFIWFKNQVTVCSDFPSEAMLWIKEVEMVDFIGWINIFAIISGKNFSRDAGREDCFCSEQDHPEFPIQEERQSRGTERPERGPVSKRKTDRRHDLRLLSGYWRSWYSIGLRWFVLCPLFETIMFRNSIHVIYIKDTIWLCPNESQQNEDMGVWATQKLYWNCTTWRFIRRYRCPIINNWRRWWKEV